MTGPTSGQRASPEEMARLTALLCACGEGDRAAFRALYEKTSPKVFGIVCLVVRDRTVAEEVTQDVYVQIWTSAARYRPETGSALAWIAAIARNKAIDRLRADRARGFVAFTDEVPDIAGPGDLAELSIDAGRVREIMAGLRPDYRRALLLAYFQGYTSAELAERLGIPVGTAKSWLRRGLAALREALQ